MEPQSFEIEEEEHDDDAFIHPVKSYLHLFYLFLTIPIRS